MSTPIIISGTDTGIGKTVFSAALTLALGGVYYKPVQCGLDEQGRGDRDWVEQATGLGADHLLPEAYRLTHPLSPHRAAELDGIEIDPARLGPPSLDRPLVIEGAGGLLVPVTRHLLQIDLFRSWGAPVVLCARTALGTINHTLLSLEALRARDMTVLGIAFIGDENADNQRTIAEISGVRVLGRLPIIDVLTPQALGAAFAANFRLSDFQVGP